MIIKSVQVKNFRCIKDETLQCEDLTVLVGPNGCGKSSFLRAIDLFYALPGKDTKVTEEDFYNKDITQSIVISITFASLTQEEAKLYKAYLDGSSLTVDKQITFPGGKGNEKYFGSKMQNPDFQEVRKIGAATPKRQAYDTIREQYAELPSVRRADDIEPALEEWEQNHPQHCKRIPDSGQFFGFEEVGNARLERFTKFFLVPAVRDASEEATEGRGSCLTDLMDLVVRQVLLQKPELEEFRTDVSERYRELMDAKKLPELPRLADDLTKILQTYTPDAMVSLDWIIGEPNVPTPTACASLVEDDYKGEVSKKGHGLQRAFILTLLQHLAIVKVTTQIEEQKGTTELTEEAIAERIGTNASTVTPNLVIAIEEPELYQHPNRQRHLAKVFLQLTESGLGSVERVQIIHSTHSPLFVGLERFDKIRIFRKERGFENLPKETRVKFVTMDKIAEALEKATGSPKGSYTASSIRARLTNLMTPWVNEGFFANVVALVEGESDQSAILGVAKQIGFDFEKDGISVIPVKSKNSLANPYLIFTTLGIQTYVVFDCHKTDNKEKFNKLLLELCGYPEEDLPKTTVKDKMACFEDDLEAILKAEIGEEIYNQLLEQHADEFGYNAERGEKNPLVNTKIVEEAYKRGKKIQTLENIVNAVVALKK
jgi:putative ATP-dependent endonuclease of OLD family